MFYDDITSASDICVMAVSRLRLETEVPGDTVSDVLWRKFPGHRTWEERESGKEWMERVWVGGVVVNTLQLYGVIDRYMAAFLPAVALTHLVSAIK